MRHLSCQSLCLSFAVSLRRQTAMDCSYSAQSVSSGGLAAAIITNSTILASPGVAACL
jgi:hypothetical protein